MGRVANSCCFQELLQTVLKLASDSDVPDLRDRGFVYWRLLSCDPDAAKDVVLCEKASIDESSSKHDHELLNGVRGVGRPFSIVRHSGFSNGVNGTRPQFTHHKVSRDTGFCIRSPAGYPVSFQSVLVTNPSHYRQSSANICPAFEPCCLQSC